MFKQLTPVFRGCLFLVAITGSQKKTFETKAWFQDRSLSLPSSGTDRKDDQSA